MNNIPRVNVLIANHNYAEWVCDALQSACDQTYPNLAITIVDAASTDDSWQRILKFMFRDTQYKSELKSDYTVLRGIKDCNSIANKCEITAIKLLSSSGPSYARNIGIKETLEQTDVYAILDADDIYYKNKVIRCMQEMVKSPSVGVVYTDYDTLNTETNVKAREYKQPYDKEVLSRDCIVHSGALVSKNALVLCSDQFGFYDEEMRTCEDYDLWVRISEKYMILHVPESHSLVRIQPRNSTQTVDKSIWQKNWQRIVLKTQARNSQNNGK